MVFLPVMRLQAMNFDLRIGDKSSPLKGLLSGYVGVTNAGTGENWLAHPMAMANLYGFGPLAWNPDAEVKSMAQNWVRLTLGNEASVVNTVTGVLLDSWGRSMSATPGRWELER